MENKKGILQTFVFHSNDKNTATCIAAGVSGVVVDWERSSAERSQNLYNSLIRRHGSEDLSTVRSMDKTHIICRVNGGNDFSADEIRQAIDLGADEILLPMVSSLPLLENLIAVVNGQALASAMIETNEGIDLAEEIAKMPLSKVFVGLNDLAICRNSSNIFLPLIDGTIESIRSHFSCEFGVAGVTHPRLGQPLPSLLILRELKRLDCNFTFLRRSFFADLEKYSAKEIISCINEEFGDNSVDLQASYLKLKEMILAMPVQIRG